MSKVENIVTTKQLRESWKRTEGFLLDARSHLSEIAEADCIDQISEFHDYLQHNELELALVILEKIFEKSGFENWRVLELMALAAASMSLEERKTEYDRQLSEARGWTYHTKIN